MLAKIESHKAGYEEAILLDDQGHVCEGSGENIFVVRDGVIFTPPQTASILDGINRKSVIQIARDLGIEVVERDIARAELYLADEVFLTGTAAELVPVREIDDHTIGDGRARRDHARRADGASTTRCTGAPSATASGSTRCPVARAAALSARSEGRDDGRRALRRHPARRHGRRRHDADRRRRSCASCTGSTSSACT